MGIPFSAASFKTHLPLHIAIRFGQYQSMKQRDSAWISASTGVGANLVAASLGAAAGWLPDATWLAILFLIGGLVLIPQLRRQPRRAPLVRTSQVALFSLALVAAIAVPLVPRAFQGNVVLLSAVFALGSLSLTIRANDLIRALGNAALICGGVGLNHYGIRLLIEGQWLEGSGTMCAGLGVTCLGLGLLIDADLRFTWGCQILSGVGACIWGTGVFFAGRQTLGSFAFLIGLAGIAHGIGVLAGAREGLGILVMVVVGLGFTALGVLLATGGGPVIVAGSLIAAGLSASAFAGGTFFQSRWLSSCGTLGLGLGSVTIGLFYLSQSEWLAGLALIGFGASYLVAVLLWSTSPRRAAVWLRRQVSVTPPKPHSKGGPNNPSH